MLCGLPSFPLGDWGEYPKSSDSQLPGLSSLSHLQWTHHHLQSMLCSGDNKRRQWEGRIYRCCITSSHRSTQTCVGELARAAGKVREMPLAPVSPAKGKSWWSLQFIRGIPFPSPIPCLHPHCKRGQGSLRSDAIVSHSQALYVHTTPQPTQTPHDTQ